MIVCGADVDVLPLRQVGCLAVRTDAKRDDDRAGGRGEQHVVFRDRADAWR